MLATSRLIALSTRRLLDRPRKTRDTRLSVTPMRRAMRLREPRRDSRILRFFPKGIWDT